MRQPRPARGSVQPLLFVTALLLIPILFLALSGSAGEAIIAQLLGQRPAAPSCPPPALSAAKISGDLSEMPASDMGCATLLTPDFERQMCFRRDPLQERVSLHRHVCVLSKLSGFHCYICVLHASKLEVQL